MNDNDKEGLENRIKGLYAFIDAETYDMLESAFAEDVRQVRIEPSPGQTFEMNGSHNVADYYQRDRRIKRGSHYSISCAWDEDELIVTGLFAGEHADYGDVDWSFRDIIRFDEAHKITHRVSYHSRSFRVIVTIYGGVIFKARIKLLRLF